MTFSTEIEDEMYEMDEQKPRHEQRYTYKKCLSMMLLIYIKQLLNNI